MKIKELRAKYNVSQAELAKILNISQKSISNYEKGESEPTESTLIKIADHFHLTIDELVGHEVPYLINKSKYTDVQLEIIKAIEFLNNEQSYMLLAYIDGMKSIQRKQENLIEKINKGV